MNLPYESDCPARSFKVVLLQVPPLPEVWEAVSHESYFVVIALIMQYSLPLQILAKDLKKRTQMVSWLFHQTFRDELKCCLSVAELGLMLG